MRSTRVSAQGKKVKEKQCKIPNFHPGGNGNTHEKTTTQDRAAKEKKIIHL